MLETSGRQAQIENAAVAPPCAMVIFGAGGDLTKRLLMPAIYNLSHEGLLPEDFAIVGVDLAQMEVTIFTQIGFVVLVGLASKNAILIVEFARARRNAGAGAVEATLEACRLRLRPILMTSFAFILGVVPLVWAIGAGAELRQTLGTAVFAGMIGVTAFGLLFTPTFYVVSRWIAALARRRPARSAAQPAE